MNDLIDKTIKSLYQTKPVNVEITLDEFGEAYWIAIVIELNNGQLIQLNEYDCHPYSESKDNLITAELTQENYSLSDIQNKKIISLTDYDDEFSIVLENNLCLSCPGAPGGNYPFIYENEDE